MNRHLFNTLSCFLFNRDLCNDDRCAPDYTLSCDRTIGE